MSIDLQCDACGKRYRVSDQMAGKRMSCKECGARIEIPADEVVFEEYGRSSNRRTGKKSKRKQSSSAPWIIAGVAGGVLGLVGLVAVGAMLMKPSAPPTTIPGTQTPMPASAQTPLANGAVPAQPAANASQPVAAAPQPAMPVRNAEYEKNLAKQTLERAHQGIVNRFTSPKSAIVVINGVNGIEADADHYLERKIFKAAYAEYEAGQQRAQQMTEANRKQAEERAVSEQQNQFGGFGPRTVWYQYKYVQSDVPYPEVRGGAAGEGKFVYYVGPATDLNQLGSRIGVGQVASVDANTRTVTITAALPVPIPDIDVEELLIQYGREAVVTLDITGANGDRDRVTYFLETEVQKLGGDKTTLTFVGPRAVEPGRYRFTVGPVKNIQELAALISFGSISDLDQAQQVITVAAKIPDDLPPRPSPAEIAERERKRREGDNNPQEGESDIDWTIRVLKKKEADPSLLEKIVKRLAAMPVDEERHDDVVDALIAGIDNTWAWHRQDDYMRAMEVWYNKRIAKQFCNMLLESNPKFDKKKMLTIVAQNPSDDVARAAASLMGDFFVGKEAGAALLEMGPVAEDAVLKYILDQDAKKRYMVYEILAEIGTKKSLGKLKSNLQKERDQEMKAALKDVVDRLQTRLKEAEASNGEKS